MVVSTPRVSVVNLGTNCDLVLIKLVDSWKVDASLGWLTAVPLLFSAAEEELEIRSHVSNCKNLLTIKAGVFSQRLDIAVVAGKWLNVFSHTCGCWFQSVSVESCTQQWCCVSYLLQEVDKQTKKRQDSDVIAADKKKYIEKIEIYLKVKSSNHMWLLLLWMLCWDMMCL